MRYCTQRFAVLSALLAVLACMMLLVAGGCANQAEDSEYHVEYLNKDKNKIIKMPYETEVTETDALIQEFITVLSTDSDNVECRKPISGGVTVTSYSLDGALLTLYFSTEYSQMNAVEEVLCRAAVVRTMTQIKGIDCVSFYVGDKPLSDANGTIVGTMNEESFIENPGEQINSIQNTTLTLYFSNEAGDGLIKEVRKDVYYSSNISMEKLIMEQLLEGPQSEIAKSAIPNGTRLVSVSVSEGVCYVSLDETFKNQDYKVNEAVVIYSIVDSLTELPSINKVQISINGDTSGVYRDTYKLSTMYEQNLVYVKNLGDTAKEE